MYKQEQGATLLAFCEEHSYYQNSNIFPTGCMACSLQYRGYHLSKLKMYRPKLFFGVSLWNKQGSLIL